VCRSFCSGVGFLVGDIEMFSMFSIRLGVDVSTDLALLSLLSVIHVFCELVCFSKCFSPLPGFFKESGLLTTLMTLIEFKQLIFSGRVVILLLEISNFSRNRSSEKFTLLSDVMKLFERLMSVRVEGNGHGFVSLLFEQLNFKSAGNVSRKV